MAKFKVFISSVQDEFVTERHRLYDFIKSDDFFTEYFDPFIFENAIAQDASASRVYIEQAEQCDVYLVLIGQQYGNALPDLSSPTEQEYMAAGKGNAYRVGFIKDLNGGIRDLREETFFRKVQSELTYREFANVEVLISLVKSSLNEYLKYKGIIQTKSFDEQTLNNVTLQDIDDEKVSKFVKIASQRRGFPLSETANTEQVLQHLRLMRRGVPCNGALLAFGKDPQYFFPAAVIKCAWFLGTETVKPMEDYQTFDGDVLEQINRATSWVMSKLSLRVGLRDKSVQNDTEYELPRSVIFETIVNAVTHRDYNSKGSVQVSVFRNRIVVRNPGTLPVDLKLEDLSKEHGSFPQNPFLAEVLYQTGYIEKYGTGTLENIRKMHEAKLLAPDINLTAEFITTIWRRNVGNPNGDVDNNLASNLAGNLASNLASKDAINQSVHSLVAKRMSRAAIEDCILRLCVIEHSTEELANVLQKNVRYLRNEIIPSMVQEGKLLPTKQKTDPSQCYITHPKREN